MSSDITKQKQDSEMVETVEQANFSHSAGHGLHGARTMDPEHRARVEKSLKRKLDARCGLFVLIYVSDRHKSESSQPC